MSDVVICQSLARRRAATREAKLLRQKLRAMSVILIQAIWRSYNSNKQYTKNKLGVILLQATIRRWRTERHSAATTIAAHWRRLHCCMTYKQTIRGMHCNSLSSADDIVVVLTYTLTSSLDVIVCQSVVRRHIATNNVDILRQGRCICAATVIQVRWRTFDAAENFARVKLKVAFLQSLFRCWVARTYLQGCKTAATKITSTWKMINCQIAYNQIINGK